MTVGIGTVLFIILFIVVVGLFVYNFINNSNSNSDSNSNSRTPNSTNNSKKTTNNNNNGNNNNNDNSNIINSILKNNNNSGANGNDVNNGEIMIERAEIENLKGELEDVKDNIAMNETKKSSLDNTRIDIDELIKEKEGEYNKIKGAYDAEVEKLDTQGDALDAKKREKNNKYSNYLTYKKKCDNAWVKEWAPSCGTAAKLYKSYKDIIDDIRYMRRRINHIRNAMDKLKEDMENKQKEIEEEEKTKEEFLIIYNELMERLNENKRKKKEIEDKIEEKESFIEGLMNE